MGEKLETIQAWQMDKVKRKKEGTLAARRNTSKVHFCHIDGLVAPQECGVRTKISKVLEHVQCSLNKARLGLKLQPLRSWMSLRDYQTDGFAADAISAYARGKMEDAPKLLKIPKSECPDIWIRIPRHRWPKSWSSMEDPVVPLERNLYGHPLAGLFW